MRQVVQGTCGWSDTTLVDCGRFYPRKSMTAAEKMSIYSRKGLFGCVEVDSSNYVIPKVDSVTSWVKATPPGFVFHFKAYGFLVNGTAAYPSLPTDIRDLLGAYPPNKPVTLAQIGIDQERLLWERFHKSLQPAIAAGKMGVVVFQFQLNVAPSPESRAHVEHCAQMLQPGLRMAVEFRNRLWFSATNLESTLTWLRTLRAPDGVALISCDDLASEVYSAKEIKELFNLQPGDDHLPIVLSASANSKFAYVRLHRRIGTERLLSAKEIDDWVERLVKLFDAAHPDDPSRKELEGPLYFLWGTDHEDQPMINAQRLASKLPKSIAPTWSEQVKLTDKQSIRASFFRAAAAGEKKALEEAPRSPPPASSSAGEEEEVEEEIVVVEEKKGEQGKEAEEVQIIDIQPAASPVKASKSPLPARGTPSKKRTINTMLDTSSPSITSFFKPKK